MKQIILLLISALLVLPVMQAQTTRQLSEFNQVAAATGIKVILTKSGETKVSLELEDCEPEDIVTEIKGGELVIKFKNSRNWSHSKNRKAIVTVFYRDIQGVSVSSGANITAENVISASALTLDGSSGGIMELEVKAANLNAGVSSGGILKVGGSTDKLEVDVSSGGIFKSPDLASEEANADASSGGVASFSVKKRLQADASSGGVIRYKGDPEKLHTNASSAGSIRSQK